MGQLIVQRGAGGAANPHNYLANGGFWFAQRQTPATLTTIADADYGPDFWKVFAENTSVQYRRYQRGDSGSSFTNLTAHDYGRLAKITTNGQVAFAQPLEGADTAPLIGRTVRFQLQLRADAAATWKIGLLEWQGAKNALTDDIVSAWGDPPTWAASYSLLASASCSVTTSFQGFSVAGTPSSSCTNLLVVLWSAADLTAGSGYLEASEAGLYVGDGARAWLPLDCGDELRRCQRWYCKTFDVDQAPVQNIGSVNSPGVLMGLASATTGLSVTWPFPVRMRAAPTVTTYNPRATATSFRDTANSDSRTCNQWGIGDRGCVFYSATGATAGAYYEVHASADASL